MVVAHKILLSATVPIGIRGLGLGLDNYVQFALKLKKTKLGINILNLIFYI